MGRIKWGDDVRQGIIEVIAKGNTQKCACDMFGVPIGTFAEWMEKKPDYAERVKKAEVRAEVACVDIILKAAEKSWTAAAWYLERKKPNDWALQHRITGDKENPVSLTIEYVKPAAGGVEKIVTG